MAQFVAPFGERATRRLPECCMANRGSSRDSDDHPNHPNHPSHSNTIYTTIIPTYIPYNHPNQCHPSAIPVPCRSSVKRLEYAGQGAQAKRPKPLGGLAARTSQPVGAGGPPGPPWGTTAMAAARESSVKLWGFPWIGGDSLLQLPNLEGIQHVRLADFLRQRRNKVWHGVAGCFMVL